MQIIDQVPDELLVVKLGTDTITQRGGANRQVLASIVNETAELVSQGVRVIIVSSGAVGAGIPAHATDAQIEQLKERRSLVSTIGQRRLMDSWAMYFGLKHIEVAQWLTEPHDFKAKKPRDVMEHNFAFLPEVEGIYDCNIVPIVNANDFTTAAGFKTDNDALAGFITRFLPAKRKVIVLLTNQRGVLERYPDSASVFRQIDVNRQDVRHCLHSEGSANGSGSMESKYGVAESVALAGHDAYIGDGRVEHAIQRLLQKVDGTYFVPALST